MLKLKDYRYTARYVVNYIDSVYGEKIKIKDVPLGLSSIYEALEKLGFTGDECDIGYSDPRKTGNSPKFMVGDIVLVRAEDTIGIFEKDSSNGKELAIRRIEGFKNPSKYAWWDAEKVELLKSHREFITALLILNQEKKQ